jgi:hypothetical protein
MEILNEELQNLKEKVFRNKHSFYDYSLGDEVQLQVKENHKQTGKPIFVREDGKVGFPTINSIPIKIGETVKGTLKYDGENYFFVEVQEIIASS